MRKIFLFLFFTSFVFAQNPQKNVAGFATILGTDAMAPSSILEARSTTKGVLDSRMTTTQKNAISSPATGLRVYDTTLGRFCYYNGSSWITMANAGVPTLDEVTTAGNTTTNDIHVGAYIGIKNDQSSFEDYDSAGLEIHNNGAGIITLKPGENSTLPESYATTVAIQACYPETVVGPDTFPEVTEGFKISNAYVGFRGVTIDNSTLTTVLGNLQDNDLTPKKYVDDAVSSGVGAISWQDVVDVNPTLSAGASTRTATASNEAMIYSDSVDDKIAAISADGIDIENGDGDYKFFFTDYNNFVFKSTGHQTINNTTSGDNAESFNLAQPIKPDGSNQTDAYMSDIDDAIDASEVYTDNAIFSLSGAYQPLNAFLTSIAGTASQTNYGRGFLTQVDAAGARSYIGAGTGSGDALTANPLSQFASTTSSQLRSTLSDELGTGADLFDGATPTSLILTNATGLPQSGVTNLVTDLAAKEAALTFSTGLNRSANTITANLATGVSGGQTVTGGTGASENLTVQSTTNGTKGNILLAPTASGEVWQGTTTPNPLPSTGDTANHLYGLVNEGTAKQMFSMWAIGSGAGFFQNNMHFYRARGTTASPTAVQSGDFFKSEGFRGQNATGTGNMSQSQGSLQVVAAENWTGSAMGLRIQGEITAVGSTNRVGSFVFDGYGASFGRATSQNNTANYDFDLWGNNMVLGSQSGVKTRGNTQDKTFRILSVPYTIANNPSAVVLGVNNSSANILYFGGGSGSYNAATQLNFYTAANNNTATGTVRFNTNTSGLTYFGGSTSATSTVEIAGGSSTVAPLVVNSGTFLSTTKAGAIENNGTHLFYTAANAGTRYQLDQQVFAGSFSGVGTATTTFTVTIGSTMANTTYKVTATPTNILSAAVFYVTNKTTTTFDVVYLAGLTGTVEFDYHVVP